MWMLMRISSSRTSNLFIRRRSPREFDQTRYVHGVYLAVHGVYLARFPAGRRQAAVVRFASLRLAEQLGLQVSGDALRARVLESESGGQADAGRGGEPVAELDGGEGV